MEYRPDETSHLVASQFSGPFLAATFDTAFDSSNRMAVGFNMYLGSQFVGLYEDPLGPGTEPTDYLNDLFSMAFALDFDDNDNLYVGDINRARIMVYRKPMGDPDTEDDSSRSLWPPAPAPEYPATIREVSPTQTACVLRSAAGHPEGSLELTVDGLPQSGALHLLIRRIGSAEKILLAVDGVDARIRDGRIWVDGTGLHLWGQHPSLSATVQVMQNGRPVTGWSPKFVIADDAATCNESSFTLQPRPTPVPPSTVTQTPLPMPSAPPTPTALATLSPTRTPALGATVQSSAARPRLETPSSTPQPASRSSTIGTSIFRLPSWLMATVGLTAMLLIVSTVVIILRSRGRGPG